MIDPSDTLFIEMAVAKGYLDRDTADEALNIQRATEADGEERRLLREIVGDEGWMTVEQVHEVDEQIQGGSEHTGKIEGYRLLAKIGQGGMGAVYKAEREETGEVCALKILPRRMAERQDFVERFLREARAAAKMKSMYIVQPIDVGVSGGYYYFAMEYVKGESVDTTLSIDGAISESKALKIVHQMAIALRDAESVAMVHRDIKPGNILVTAEGVAKLTDFGLARQIDDHSVTQTGVTLGTPNYMSPEQAKAMKSLDVRSDIYSLGVTFYHMVTGEVPFKGETSLHTMLKHINEPPVAPIELRPDLSRGGNDVILKMLAKNRDQRYGKPDELIKDVELVMEGKPPSYAASTAPAADAEGGGAAEVPEEIERFAREIRKQGLVRWLRMGVALFAAVLVGIAVWKLGFGEKDPGPEDAVVSAAGGGADQKKGSGPTGGLKASPRREREAQMALDKAKRDAEDDPKLLIEIERAFADAEEKCRSTSLYPEAKRLHEEYRRKRDAAVSAAVSACRKEARARTDEDKFGEALAAYDTFPGHLRTEATIKPIERDKRKLREKAWDRWGELKQRAESYVTSRKWSHAKRTVEAAREFGIPGITTKANELLAEYDKAETAASVKNREAIEAYRKAFSQIRSHVRRGRFPQARTALVEQRAKAAHELVRTMLAGMGPILNAAERVWANVLAGAQALRPGDTLRVRRGSRPMSMRFEKFDAATQRLHLKPRGGKVLKVLPGWLPAESLKRLATAGSGGNVKAVDLAAFFLARGDHREAGVEILRAKATAPEAVTKSYEQQRSLLRDSHLEIEAENLFAKAREQAADEDHQQTALTLLELVDNYSETRCYARHRRQIEVMLAKAEAESITVDTLFAVKVAPLPGGSSELKYDFSDPAQGRDWLTVWKKSSVGRWPIRHVYGEMTAECGLVYFKVPVRGNYEVVVKAKDMRHGSVRLGMPEPARSHRTAGVSFTWKRVGGGMESTLTKAGEVLCPAKKLSDFRVVGPLQLTLQIRNGMVTAKAGNRPLHRASLKLTPDERKRRGYIVLDGFNLGARIVSVTIRCTLDRKWLEETFVERLREEKRQEARWRMARYKPLLPGKDASSWRLSSPDGGAPRWSFTDKGYAKAPENTTCVMTTDTNWSDFTFSTRVRTGTAPGNVRTMVRWADASTAGGGQGYFVKLTAGSGATGTGGKVILGKALGGRLEELKAADVKVIGTAWYQVHVEVRGPNIRVLFGGRPILSAKDDTYPAGRVGLASDRCGAQFRDIKIKVMKR